MSCRLRTLAPLVLVVSWLGCGDDDPGAGGGGGSSSTTTGSGEGGGATAGGGDVPSTTTSSGDGGGSSTTTATSTSTSAAGGGDAGGGSAGGGDPGVDDPDLAGPYTTTSIDDVVVSPSGNDVPVRAVYPTGGPSAGPYPVVVVAHGFQLPVSQYESYVQRLASHGFVAVTADFPTDFFSANNVANAMDVLAGLDWAAEALPGVADADNAGLTGHSLGGKLSLLAATMDDRVRATITLDPVDGAMQCDPADCPDVSDLMPLAIPTGFLGETLDAVPSGFSPQACAPAADNYTTFYAGTTAPSLSVTVNGAGHMSFLDDLAGCGFTCSFCADPTTANDVVNRLANAYVVAFYRRHLGGEVAYDAYLTGPEAQARYVDTGLVSIESK